MKNSFSTFVFGKSQFGARKSIARKTLFFILLFSSFVTILVTGFQLYRYYQEQARAVDRRMTQIELSYRDSLANAIWFFDAKQIESNLSGIMKFEDVHYAAVDIKTGGQFYRGERRQGENLRVFSAEILHVLKNRTVLVGHLLIESNLEGVVQRVSDQFWQILMSQALKTFFVSLFILFIIYFVITRHLIAISTFASSLDIGNKNKFLSLQRTKKTPNDELDQIVLAMNRMKVDLIADAAERVQTEIRLRKLSQAIEQSSAAILILDAERGIEYVNTRFKDSTGFSSADVLGEVADSYIFGDKTTDACQTIWRLILSGKKWREEIHSYRKDGSQFWEIVSASPLIGQNQKITHFLVSKDDISDLRQAEINLRRSQKMEAVGQLTGGIAHDFNNILGIILGNLEIIQSLPSGDSKITGRINAARKAVERGADITRKLLGFSRKDPHEVRLVDINESVNNLLELITKSLTVSIDVNAHLADDLWTVEIDSGDFEDAILNLALNARDAMPGGGKLTIETSNKVLDEKFVTHNPTAAAGSYVQVSISDTGVGMPEKVIDRVFDPFFTTKEVGKGTGLGLSMVYGFVERSSGFITIVSEIDIGTVFHLFIPRTVEKETDLGESRITTDNLPRGHEKILIVDDEEGLRDIATINLGELGYNTLAVGDGPSALKLLEQERDIDLLFSDVVMPNFMNAYELAQKAHKSHPQLKILLTSGYDEKLDEIENGDPFLNKLSKTQLKKPYAISELAIAIRKALDNGL